MGARNNEVVEGDIHISDVIARPVLSRILLPSAYYMRGLSFFNNCDHICQQTVNFTVGCDSSAAWQTCCNTVFWRDGSGGMYLWRHTLEHQQVTDFVIAFLSKADIGRNGYWSRDINLQSKKVCGLFISPTGLFLFITVEVTIQPCLKNSCPQSAALWAPTISLVTTNAQQYSSSWSTRVTLTIAESLYCFSFVWPNRTFTLLSAPYLTVRSFRACLHGCPTSI